MGLPNTFAAKTQATGAQLDENFAALGALTPIPCTVSGANALVLTALANTPNVNDYSNYMQFTAIATQSNTGPSTAKVGSLATLSVYKQSPSGPLALTGGEIVTGTAITLLYSSALNSNAGGFYLLTPVQPRRLFTRTSLSFPALAPGGVTSANIPLTGTSVNDIVAFGLPSNATIGILYQGVVSPAGTVGMQVLNVSAFTITPPAGTYGVLATGYY